ncbi:formamidopyrimidine-DNA glycosylase [Actinomycetospora endophytica]|uniref:Formamidopyrimidine-DNA glycosylase n=1 Tax=Actinomycetospora endophytica TaxID=2291215 RepID=A0ABS8PER5_9PSEU|nr:DNA-formamidopyrimidine glycosylase family protein [Actinomycetospora endophytica]MCD2196763.1 formamidopyrimidine-DNA glycosylase [Actinomycetospora endophytica]
MPELPEAESARAVIERSALGRRIVAVDDGDGYVCRPHAPGEIAAALVGEDLAAAHRRGKTLWCDTATGPVLGIHLGMSGKIVISDVDGTEVDGGDYWEFGRAPGDYRWSRFSLTFDDGGMLRLVDPRRLGRIRLDPPLDGLGPDAATITPKQFATALGSGRGPVKARLLDQHALAGVGNLLADDILWRARLAPDRPVDELTAPERTRLQRALRATIGEALRDGGVHTLPLVAHRHFGGHCPRDGTELRRATVGGRTSYWCPKHQL